MKDTEEDKNFHGREVMKGIPTKASSVYKDTVRKWDPQN